jgi:hypothetical protein
MAPSLFGHGASLGDASEGVDVARAEHNCTFLAQPSAFQDAALLKTPDRGDTPIEQGGGLRSRVQQRLQFPLL